MRSRWPLMMMFLFALTMIGADDCLGSGSKPPPTCPTGLDPWTCKKEVANIKIDPASDMFMCWRFVVVCVVPQGIRTRASAVDIATGLFAQKPIDPDQVYAGQPIECTPGAQEGLIPNAPPLDYPACDATFTSGAGGSSTSTTPACNPCDDGQGGLLQNVGERCGVATPCCQGLTCVGAMASTAGQCQGTPACQ